MSTKCKEILESTELKNGHQTAPEIKLASPPFQKLSSTRRVNANVVRHKGPILKRKRKETQRKKKTTNLMRAHFKVITEMKIMQNAPKIYQLLRRDSEVDSNFPSSAQLIQYKAI